jgi:hypothetical protein
MLVRRSLQETGAKAAIVGGVLNGIFLLIAAPLPAVLTVHAWLNDERPKAIAGALITAAFLAGSAYSFAISRWAKRSREARARESA